MLARRVASELCLTLALVGCTQQPAPVAPSNQSAAAGASPESSPRALARARLRAVIRDQSFLDHLSDSVRASTISEPFSGRMVILYLVDDHGAARGAQDADLAESGVTREALRAVAEWNLAQGLKERLTCTSHAVTERARHGFYESSRLLFDKQWADLAAKEGTVVVAAPSNDTLFVACNPSPETLQQLAVIVQNTYPQAPRPVSPSLLTWSSDGWRELPTP
jgi:hypothetical protein